MGAILTSLGLASWFVGLLILSERVCVQGVHSCRRCSSAGGYDRVWNCGYSFSNTLGLDPSCAVGLGSMVSSSVVFCAASLLHYNGAGSAPIHDLAWRIRSALAVGRVRRWKTRVLEISVNRHFICPVLISRVHTKRYNYEKQCVISWFVGCGDAVGLNNCACRGATVRALALAYADDGAVDGSLRRNAFVRTMTPTPIRTTVKREEEE